jgi:toxin CptA
VQFPVILGLHRSRFLDIALLVGAMLPTAVVLASRQPIGVQGSLMLAIWMLAGLAWRRLSPKLSAIRLERTGHVFICNNDGNDFVAARLLPDAAVHPWLTVIRLRTDDGQRHTLIATVDSLNQQDFRRLRVFMRWQAEFQRAG